MNAVKESITIELKNKIRNQLYNSQNREINSSDLFSRNEASLNSSISIFNSTKLLPLGNFEKEDFFVKRMHNSKQLQEEFSIDSIFKKLERKKEILDRNDPKNFIHGL